MEALVRVLIRLLFFWVGEQSARAEYAPTSDPALQYYNMIKDPAVRTAMVQSKLLTMSPEELVRLDQPTRRWILRHIPPYDPRDVAIRASLGMRQVRSNAAKDQPAMQRAKTIDAPVARATRNCPFCAETILAEAIVCRFCGRDLPAFATPKPEVPSPAFTPPPPNAEAQLAPSPAFTPAPPNPEARLAASPDFTPEPPNHEGSTDQHAAELEDKPFPIVAWVFLVALMLALIVLADVLQR